MSGHPAERRGREALRALEGGPVSGGDPRVVLRWAVRSFARRRLALVSAFGPGSLVLIDLLAEMGAHVPVIFIDTLHHFPETLAHVERVRARYELDLRVFRAAESRAAFERDHGPRLWERDLERFHHLTKIEPFRHATEGLDAYLTGRRRDQTPVRAGLRVVEGGDRPEGRAPEDGSAPVQGGAPLKINPLASWTREDIWRFIREREIRYNPLHDRGYASIGDEPLTTPVLPHEPERAGRWRGWSRLECGIHTLEITEDTDRREP